MKPFDTTNAGAAQRSGNGPGAEQRIEAGDCDLVGVSRLLISDPAWAKKGSAGEPFLPFHPRVLAAIH